ncbi:DUF6090 family protein [Bizionia psychrotolerans]|uniref:DUF6090 family protein n=1 Tax=Bizionia psychrotolerans TaxID=1492901 RepID=UPI00069E9CA6|nr:DUF6090 family protein [Bizionia psychrotolerans]
MIKFFRNIRKNLLTAGKTGSYFKYAIGEIILVVIGILIALSINNWNEERKELKLESKFIELLKQDLSSDSESLAELVEISDASVISKNLILDYQDGKILKPDSLSTHFLRAVFHGIPSFVPNKGAIEDIQNAGGLSLIKNEAVNNQILKLYNTYERFEKNLGQPYIENRNISRQLVFQKANGFFFKSDFAVDEEILNSLLLDSEIKNRLINNWAVTYNESIKEVLKINKETIEVCLGYIQEINN